MGRTIALAALLLASGCTTNVYQAPGPADGPPGEQQADAGGDAAVAPGADAGAPAADAGPLADADIPDAPGADAAPAGPSASVASFPDEPWTLGDPASLYPYVYTQLMYDGTLAVLFSAAPAGTAKADTVVVEYPSTNQQGPIQWVGAGERVSFRHSPLCTTSQTVGTLVTPPGASFTQRHAVVGTEGVEYVTGHLGRVHFPQGALVIDFVDLPVTYATKPWVCP